MTRWSREAFYHIAAGMWATRVDVGLTTEEEAVKRLAESMQMIDRMFP